MLPWVHLATATAPGGDTLRLLRRGDEFSIRLQGGNELMNSRLGGSEEALATLALARVADRPAPRVLIGGLGMGFTLRAAQAVAPPGARLVVSEIVPELVGWAEEHMTTVFGGCLSDPRVEVRIGDVGAAIREAGARFEAILLDVDNGPDGLTRDGERRALPGERPAGGAPGAGSRRGSGGLVGGTRPRLREAPGAVRASTSARTRFAPAARGAAPATRSGSRFRRAAEPAVAARGARFAAGRPGAVSPGRRRASWSP